MDVILLEKMRNLGSLGDTVKVKPGFARNYLVPQEKAVYATKNNIVKFAKQRDEFEKLAQDRHAKAIERQAELQALPMLTITAKAAEGGKLFGSIGIRDVVILLANQGVTVEKRQVFLPQGTLRMAGEYEISIDLGGDVIAIVKLNIVPQG